MNKDIKLFVKQEKRIVKLLYRKGFIDPKDINILYWEEYKRVGTKSPVRFYPEIHFSVRDYWGEIDEYGLVDDNLQGLYFANKINDEEDDSGWPISTFKYSGVNRYTAAYRNWVIQYLTVLPTKRNDSKINKVLKRNFNDY